MIHENLKSVISVLHIMIGSNIMKKMVSGLEGMQFEDKARNLHEEEKKEAQADVVVNNTNKAL